MNETVKDILQLRLKALRTDYAAAKVQLEDRIQWVDETHAHAGRLYKEINDISEELLAAGIEIADPGAQAS